MKIFIDIRPLYARILSGVPEYTRFLLKNIVKAAPNEEYALFANSFKGEPENLLTVKEIPKSEMLNFGIPNRLWDLSSRFLDLPKIDKLVKADVYFSPHFDILPFKDPRSHVLTIHDLSFISYPEFFPWRKNFWHWRQNYKKQINEAGRVVAVSDFTRGDILDKFRLDDNRVVRIYPGVNDRYRKLPTNDEDLAEFKRKESLDHPFLLHVGTLEPRKNAVGVIKAFSLLKGSGKFKNLKLVLVGSKGWLYDEIIKEADRSPYRNDIRFWGRASEEELLYLYNLASVFAYPSFFEGFGFPPLEAQASGTPVVASDRSSLPEVTGKSAILVNPFKVYEIALAIEGILLENKTRDELIDLGYANVKRFNWSETAAELIGVLRETKRNG